MNEMQTKTVLIADDEPDLAELIGNVFRRNDWTVHAVSNGREGLEVFNRINPTAVVSDVRMPGGDGIDLLKAVKQRDIWKPVVLTSGFSDVSLEQSYAFGAEGVFSKPFDRKALLECVQSNITPLSSRWAQLREAKSPPIQKVVELRIGRGGMLALTPTTSFANEQLISFDIPRAAQVQSRLTGTGIIRWREHHPDQRLTQYGIEFCFLHEETRIPLYHYLQDKRPVGFIPAAMLL